MQWHKTFNYEWLTGSIRVDLTPSGRGVWADILATAGISRRQGYLERGHGVPYTISELAAWWRTPIEIVEQAFEACIKEGRLQLLEDGTYFVTNFEKYQASIKKAKKDSGNESGDPAKIPWDAEHKKARDKAMAYKGGYNEPESAIAGANARVFTNAMEKRIHNKDGEQNADVQ